MRLNSWAFDPKNPLRLSRAVFAVTALVVALSLFWLATAALATSKVHELKDTIKRNTAALTEARKTLEVAKSLPKEQPGKGGAIAVQTFLGNAQRVSKASGCKVLDAVMGDSSAYSSHFADVSSDGWAGTKVSLSLAGSMESIMKTIQTFRTFGVPYEFLSFETGRTQTDEKGNALLNAKIEMLVLVKTAGA